MQRLAAAVLTLFATTQIALAGDAAAGLAVAEERCAECHRIEAGAPPGLSPPAFAEIAPLPAEVIRSRILFPSFHAVMPRFAEEVLVPSSDDLLAYILTLRP